MRTRDETRVALNANFKQLMGCVNQLTEVEMTSCPVAGIWTVKDVLGHIWTWLDEALRDIKAWQGPRPWQEGVVYDDHWNEAQAAAKSGVPLLTVTDGLTASHRRLVSLLETEDDAFFARVGRAPWGAELTLLDYVHGMAEHYAEHSQDLSGYKAHCLESD
jgi:hypothetical protein